MKQKRQRLKANKLFGSFGKTTFVAVQKRKIGMISLSIDQALISLTQNDDG